MTLMFVVSAAMAFGNSEVNDSSEPGVRSSEVSELEVPWLSTYYIEPQVTVNDAVNIGLYVTDWWQSEYRLGINSHKFSARLRIWKKDEARETAREWNLNDIKAGDHEFNAGKFGEGEYTVELSAEDEYGRKGPVLFHEFRVVKDFAIPEKETYIMTDSDLEHYKISNKGDLGVFRFIDATGKNEKDTAALVAEEAVKVKVPSGKYVVVAGGEKYDPEENKNHRGARGVAVPEWLPNPQSWRSCKVIYADDYDKALVETNSAITGIGLNQFLKEIREKGFRKVVLRQGTYRISNMTTIDIPSGLTVDLNGSVIKMNQFAGSKGVQIQIRDGIDSHVVNGIVEGDYFEHDYANSPNNSEWVMGLSMDGESKYSSFERLVVRYISGYGVGNGFHGNRGKYTPTKNFTNGTIDEETGKELPDAKGLVISAAEDITPFVKDGGYLACSRWLGYQGMIGNDWTLRFHFYDKEGNYLETIRGRQYRIVRIPAGAEKVRVSVYADDPMAVDGLILNYFRRPWNSRFEDIFVLSARAVGMAPSAMYNFRFANCTFVRSGETLAKCAFDAEDGWDMMQDVWIVRNKFFKNPVNELLTCAGHNFIIDDNEAKLHLWSRTNGYVVRDNELKSAFCGVAAARARTGLVRISGNTYTGGVQLGDREGASVDPSLAAVDPGQWVKDDQSENEKPCTLWFATMKDFDKADSLSLGANAMLSGIKVKNKSLGRVSMAYSVLENCDFGHNISGSSFFKSALTNITGNVTYGTTLTITESEIAESTISLQNGGVKGSLVVKDTDLNDVIFPIGYWVAPQKVIFESCTFENAAKPVIRTGVYSIGEFIFKDCKFNSTNAPIVEIYDMRERHEKPGSITFENCVISENAKSPVTISARIGEGSKKVITIFDKNSRYTGELVNKKADWWEFKNLE